MDELERADDQGLSSEEFEKVFARSEPPLRAGSCVLAKRKAAAIVQQALLHFEGLRYALWSWTIMPNHVHVVVTPGAGHTLSDVLHSWKSFTSNQINRGLKRTGNLWERESFDHLIRCDRDLRRFIRYIDLNPVEAGLCDTPEAWEFSSCGAGFQPARIRFVDPRTTPFVDPRTRGELVHLQKQWGTYFVTWRLLDAVVVRGCGGT